MLLVLHSWQPVAQHLNLPPLSLASSLLRFFKTLLFLSNFILLLFMANDLLMGFNYSDATTVTLLPLWS